MVLTKCTKCGKGFRTSKAKETLCASCTVEQYAATTEDSGNVEEDFNKIAAEVYKNVNPKLMEMDCRDVFNHEKRLKKLQEQFTHMKDSKKRIRNTREAHRLLDEHEAVQQKLAQIQNLMLKAVMLSPNGITKSTAKSNEIEQMEVKATSQSNVVEPPLADPDKGSPVKRSNSVRDRIQALNNSPISSTVQTPSNEIKQIEVINPISSTANSMEKEVIALKQNNTVRKIVQEIVITPSQQTNPTLSNEIESNEIMNARTPETPDLVDADEVTPLRRNNSVRNRIKAFEALTRSASTGSWDRTNNTVFRRKLQF